MTNPESYAHILTKQPDQSWSVSKNPALPTLETELLESEAFASARNQQTQTLATHNWLGERLRFWLYSPQTLLYHYDSSPSYMSCVIVGPAGNDASVLAEAFAATTNINRLSRLLKRRRGLGFINERQRHQQILVLLGLGSSLAGRQ
jgi:hypothetical protein